jgi:hypothetical protein
MTDKATAADWLRDLAAARLDGGLSARGGFRRTGRSLVYARPVPDGRQKIHLDLLVRPRYASDAFHLSLRAAVVFPEMAKVAVTMLGPETAGYGAGGVVHIAVLDQVVPNPPMILFGTADELRAQAGDIERHLTGEMVPYLDERDTIGKLVAAMWREWSATAGNSDIAGHWPVIVAAGQLATGDRAGAQKTLQTAYPQDSPERPQYQAAFAAVAG